MISAVCGNWVLVGIVLDSGEAHFPGGGGCKWKCYLCASSVNTHGKTKVLETCLAVRPRSPFNIVVLGPLPTTLYVCFSNGAHTVIIIPGGRQHSEQNIFFLKKDNNRRAFFVSFPLFLSLGITHGASCICWAEFAFITWRG